MRATAHIGAPVAVESADMILIVVPNLQAMRHWLLRLDARLVTSELQLRWLQREKQARAERKEVDSAIGEIFPEGLPLRTTGGEA